VQQQSGTAQATIDAISHVPSHADALLDIRRLNVDLVRPEGRVPLVENLSMRIDKGERVALVGESGSGKSITAKSIMRLNGTGFGGRELDANGEINFRGRNLLSISEKQMRAVRGSEIGLVLQDPMTSLNPMMHVGDQVMEPLLMHGVGRKEARAKAIRTLDHLGIPRAAERMDSYPFEFSGGMRQRICIAMAIIAEPALLIADEPTTALDVRVQAQVLELIDSLSRELDMAVLLITHDLGVAAGYVDRVAVMYAGMKVEEASADVIFQRPGHPYTEALIAAVPRVDKEPVDRLNVIVGQPSTPFDRAGGCPFEPRCPIREDRCAEIRPPIEFVGDRHEVRCLLRGPE
jgi:peptide/nickel transport system ATP-binding protein